MKAVVNQKNFKKALSIVEKVVSKNTTLPMLSNILIKTENGRLKISATNLEVGISYSIGSKIDEVGEIAVPARILVDLINGIEDDKISISTKNNILIINSEKYKTQVLGFSASDFPIIPKIKNNLISVVQAKAVKLLLASVFDSIAISETRPELAGVYTDFRSSTVTVAATDSFRLAEKSISVKNTQTASVILPRNTVVELIRICGDIEGDLNVYLSENQIAFSSEDMDFVSRIVDGNYPDYKKVIPEKFTSKLLVNKNDLEKTVRLAGLFSSNISDVKISCSEEETKIIAKNSDKGEIETGIESLLRGEPFDVSVNYLLDGTKIIDTEKLVIEFVGAGSPIVLRPAEDKGNTLYLIMPLRNQS